MDHLLEILTRREGYPDYSNDEGFVHVLVNSVTKKRMYRGWLEGSGRGANSALSCMVLGGSTKQEFSGVETLTIPSELAAQFDGVLFWLAVGWFEEASPYRAKSIELYRLASYFGLEMMMTTIEVLGWPTDIDKAEGFC